jgi:hypothetical protein
MLTVFLVGAVAVAVPSLLFLGVTLDEWDDEVTAIREARERFTLAATSVACWREAAAIPMGAVYQRQVRAGTLMALAEMESAAVALAMLTR